MDFVFGLLALTVMEIILGIDNIVFISIVSSKLPKDQQPLARRLGLLLALVTRVLLLIVLSSVVNHLTYDLFLLSDFGCPQFILDHVSGTAEAAQLHGRHLVTPLPPEIIAERLAESNGVSWRDLVLFFGGVFLIGKSVFEIHEEFGQQHVDETKTQPKKFANVLIQIAILDMVFSLDSVITAVGMVDNIYVMIAAVVVSIFVMILFAEPVNRFVEGNPTLKMLALSFLILIGVMLVAESMGAHMDKGYIYFAMFFALIVEVMNIRLRRKTGPAVAK